MQFMDATAHRHINTASDSELLLNIFANNLQQTGKFRINEEDIFTAIGGMMQQVKGAYACVAMLAGFGIIAFRDPNGIRPVGMAVRKNGVGRDYLFASESVVADASGFTDWEDVNPGVCISRRKRGARESLSALQAKPSLLPGAEFRGAGLPAQKPLLPTSSSSFILRGLIPSWMASVFTGVVWQWVMHLLIRYKKSSWRTTLPLTWSFR